MKDVTAGVYKGLEGIKVYPTIGNHDTYPQDVIGMSIPKENEAINQWSPTWNVFINDKDQMDLFSDWGYYSLPLTNIAGE